MLHIALTIIQVFAAFAIMALVLLQRGKGADAGAGFGAGASGTVFGARGARTALSRATAIFAAVFMLNSLALAYMGTRSEPTTQRKTLLDEAAQPETPAPPAAPTSGTLPAAPAQTPAPAAPATGTAPEGTAPQSGATAPATNTPAPTPQQ